MLHGVLQKIGVIFPSSRDLTNKVSHDALLVESVKEQMHADNLTLKQEFINKVTMNQILLHNKVSCDW